MVLAADKNAEFALRGLFEHRVPAFGLRAFSYDIYVHPESDPGCAQKAAGFLRTFAATHERALVLLDFDGSGREENGPEALELAIEDGLAQAGWAGRSSAIVIMPELEAWVWSDSPHVAEALGWTNGPEKLKGWLQAKGLWGQNASKPTDPKAAVERVLRMVRKPRSSAIYYALAMKVGLDRCEDRAFAKLRRILAGWFPRA